MTQTMTAIEISRPGGPEVLESRVVERVVPGAGEVLIRVAAAGVNAPDLGQRRGTYDPPPGASPLPGLEVAGEVVALGDRTQRYAPGDRVVALCNGGGYAEFVAVPEGQVLPQPAGWSFVEAAALPETVFTVEQTLVMRAGLAPGMHVLIHGAAGGIGGAAIQIAKLHGALPIAVVSSQEKAAYARSLGAWAVIVHTEEDFVGRVKDLTGGKGADRILDMVGGDYLTRNIAASARSGHIVQIAALSPETAEVAAGAFVMKQLTLSGSTLRPQSRETKAAIADSLERSLWPALAGGRFLKPKLRTFPLGQAADAHRAMEERSNFGKIVLLTAYDRER
jgi:NADPH2:quinone reductase